MLPKNINHFYKEYTKALDDRSAALFIGAGLSAGAGFPTWIQLLKDMAKELDLDVDLEVNDLPGLAQLHVNETKARSRLEQLIVDEFSKKLPTTENHQLLAKLPIETVWTTNYDQLIEQAYQEAGKVCAVKITRENFKIMVRRKDVTLYKMHGDVTQPQDAVLIKEDYELYTTKRQVFINALEGDIVTKTFLFIGFSLTDPNIDHVLGNIKRLIGPSPLPHYCIMRRPEKPLGSGKAKGRYDYDMVRLHLRISDLKRYGIETLLVDDYSEITDILRELNRRAHRKNVFVSGSAHDYAPMGRQRVEKLSQLLGQQIIKRELNLVSGFGLGIGGTVLIGATEEVFRTENASLGDRVTMRPFPQFAPNDPQRDKFWYDYRHDMLSQVGYVVFLCGNKLDANTNLPIPADGVRKEFEIAHDLGKIVIPIGATGSVTKDLWAEVSANQQKYYGKANIKQPLATLGDDNKSDQELVKAVFEIIQETSK